MAVRAMENQAVTEHPDIAVLLPCYNEAGTIGDVVSAFRAALPSARIYVYDNNSTDSTALRATLAGATVLREPRQGKGHVVRRMFSDIEADIYVMADGDGTYAPGDAPSLIDTLIAEGADMVVGTRRGVHADAGRHGHAFGNRLFNLIFRKLFGDEFTDILSGYRVFSRRFAKSFPAISGGFEIETEMSVHALRLRLPVAEVELDYGRRPEGSHSKLSTFRDGARILWMFAMLMKETRPFASFAAIASGFMLASLFFMTPVVAVYFQTGFVERLPTWIFSMALMMIAFLMFSAGVILDSLARARIEQLRIHYMSLPVPASGRRPAARAAIADQQTGTTRAA